MGLDSSPDVFHERISLLFILKEVKVYFDEILVLALGPWRPSADTKQSLYKI